MQVHFLRDKSLDLSAHSVNVAVLATTLAAKLGLERQQREMIFMAGMLHDLGSTSVLEIISKPGTLTSDEFQQVTLHPVLGADVLVSAMGSCAEIAPVVREHHERWDGSGYPYGLMGKQILLPAAVLSVADAYDAMVSGWPYKRAMTANKALKEIERCAGSQFHPQVSECFLDHSDEILTEFSSIIATQYSSYRTRP